MYNFSSSPQIPHNFQVIYPYIVNLWNFLCAFNNSFQASTQPFPVWRDQQHETCESFVYKIYVKFPVNSVLIKIK